MKFHHLFAVLLSLFLGAWIYAGEVTFASLNAYHLYDPGLSRPGVAPKGNPLTSEQYVRKLENLSNLIAGGSTFVALQEVGGKEEFDALGRRVNFRSFFVKGRDTYTGQNVGFLSGLPANYRVSPPKRVPALDRSLSKHVHVVIKSPDSARQIHVLGVHLLRPIGENAERHQSQLRAINEWATSVIQGDSSAAVIVLGDFNSRDTQTKPTILGLGRDIGADSGHPGTHLDGRPYDRILVIGDGIRISNFEVKRPPYGPRPNDLNRLLWSDHFLVKATLTW